MDTAWGQAEGKTSVSPGPTSSRTRPGSWSPSQLLACGWRVGWGAQGVEGREEAGRPSAGSGLNWIAQGYPVTQHAHHLRRMSRESTV